VRGHRDLRRIAALALICAVLAPLLPVEVLSLLFALPLVLFLPGYALTLAIFAKRPIERPQTLLLGLGLSLSVLALGALPLNYAPSGIGPVSWAVLLLVITLGACAAAALRRPETPAPNTADRTAEVKRFLPLWRGQRVAPTGASGIGVGLVLGGLACTAAALVLTFSTTSAGQADGYTALWLLPPTPRDAVAGGARVGVDSEEQTRTAYRLQVQVGERADEIVRSFSLAPGETKVLKLTPQPPPAGTPIPVRAKLFLERKPGDVYRRVSGWLVEPKRSR